MWGGGGGRKKKQARTCVYFSRQTAGEGLKKKRKRERRSIILICERCGLLNSVSTFYTAAVDTCSASSLCLLMKNKNSNLSVAIYHATRRLFLSSPTGGSVALNAHATHTCLPVSQSVSQSIPQNLFSDSASCECGGSTGAFSSSFSFSSSSLTVKDSGLRKRHGVNTVFRACGRDCCRQSVF